MSTTDLLVRTLRQVMEHEDVSFLLTNRIPRRLLTQMMGWFSRIEQPLVAGASLRLWQLFGDLELHEAQKSEFTSVHDCFIRELKPGARPIDPDPELLVSPCDAIVGACGRIRGTQVFQAKGFPYSLEDLLIDPELVRCFHDGTYVTLRLTASMYHRFHAPHHLRVEQVNYVAGDTWNTYPIALSRVEKLFCKNERAVIRTQLARSGQPLVLVPVAAILVASIRLHFVDVLLHLRYRGPNVIPVDASFRKGQEMGWFQHGSTILVFAPSPLSLCDDVREGKLIRMGEPLMRIPDSDQLDPA